MKYTLQIFIALFFTQQSLLLAQTAVSLTLDEALSIAKEHNTENKLKSLAQEQARYDKQKSNSLFLPKISVSETGIRTNNPLAAFGFLLQQSQVQQADFNPSLLNDPGNRVNWNTQLAVEQPLINVDGYYGRKAAFYQEKASEKSTERTAQIIDFKVKEAYFGSIIAQQHQKVIEKASETINEALRIATNQQQEGYVKQVDILKLQLRKLEIDNQLIEAQNNILNANNYLSLLISGDIQTPYTATDSISTNTIVEINNSVSNTRADLQALEMMVNAQAYQSKVNQSQFIPRLNAFGQYNLNGTDFIGTKANNYLVGISLNWMMFDGGNNIASVKSSRKSLEQVTLQLEQTKQQANLELQQAIRDVALYKSKLQLLEQSITQAEEAYRISKNEFEEGLQTVSKLLEVETLLFTKKLEYQNGLYDYHMSCAKVELQAQ